VLEDGLAGGDVLADEGEGVALYLVDEGAGAGVAGDGFGGPDGGRDLDEVGRRADFDAEGADELDGARIDEICGEVPDDDAPLEPVAPGSQICPVCGRVL
jgi:hypothetical protein